MPVFPPPKPRPTSQMPGTGVTVRRPTPSPILESRQRASRVTHGWAGALSPLRSLPAASLGASGARGGGQAWREQLSLATVLGLLLFNVC